MRTLFLIAALALGTVTANAQETCETPKVKAGDILKIAAPAHSSYDHINFPKSNFIIKRGGIANYRALINQEIKVTEVTIENGCISKVDVALANGKKFFNTVKTVSVDFKEALAAKEITLK